jgi:hypothetical protein
MSVQFYLNFNAPTTFLDHLPFLYFFVGRDILLVTYVGSCGDAIMLVQFTHILTVCCRCEPQEAESAIATS